MPQGTSQPNALSAGVATGLSAVFWIILVTTGVGAGVGGGLLMKLLCLVQHLAWSYQAGQFLSAVEHAGPQRRIAVLIIAGLVAGTMRWLIKHEPGGRASAVAEALWFRSGQLPLLKSIAQAVVSIVIVGTGASLGREAAPKLTGTAIASTLSSRARFGGLLNRAWTVFWPGAPLGSFAVIGAGAVVAAAMQAPIAAILLVLELAPGSHELILPLMLAVASAVFIERRLEPRSIYSGRIHAGRLYARPAKEHAGTSFDRLISSDYRVISAAATYTDVLRAFVESANKRRPLYVVAEHGQLVGVIWPDVAGAADSRGALVSVATAFDLARKFQSLDSKMDESGVRSLFDSTKAAELPVVESGTERLLGIAKPPPDALPGLIQIGALGPYPETP